MSEQPHVQAPEEPHISVVISTYNRCELLPKVLDSLLSQEGDGLRYEVIVVDNNSSDRTREVITSYVERGVGRLRYVFEGRQGVSYGRNAGLGHARAPIIAFTDDDMFIPPYWVKRIRQTFEEHPEVDFVGGQVLPRWKEEPPGWLKSKRNWLPLGIVTYGDKPCRSNREERKDFPTCNVAFRREVFERVGVFAPEMQRVKDGIGSFEDYEFHLRMWRAGLQGLYDPELLAWADVQLERMTKEYHRRWHRGNGRFSALYRQLLWQNITAPDGTIVKEVLVELRLFGAPASVYCLLLINSLRWLISKLLRRGEALCFHYETGVTRGMSFIREAYRSYAGRRRHSHLTEVSAFAKNLLRNHGRLILKAQPGDKV